MKRIILLIWLGVLMSAPAKAVSVQIEQIASGLHHPWAVAPLPDGDFLVTERRGNILYIDRSGKKTNLVNVPDVYARSQGGMLDLVLDPDFVDNKIIWFSYASGDSGGNATRLARGRLSGNRLNDVDVIFTASPEKEGGYHFGSRIAFLPDGTLVLTVGDGYSYMQEAQNPDSHLGKTIRLNRDGTAPKDNPFVNKGARAQKVWTLGHRNPQGLVFDPVRNILFLQEHGPKGGDEINILKAGGNYGWPRATHGIDYGGAVISPHKSLPGMEDGIKVWVPSIAPSGMAVYYGDLFPDWQGDLLVGALKGRALHRVNMHGLEVTGEEQLLTDLEERIRDVRVGSDGAIYVLTDSADGRLLRLRPAK